MNQDQQHQDRQQQPSRPAALRFIIYKVVICNWNLYRPEVLKPGTWPAGNIQYITKNREGQTSHMLIFLVVYFFLFYNVVIFFCVFFVALLDFLLHNWWGDFSLCIVFWYTGCLLYCTIG